MGDNTKIQWADHTINFWIGCVKVTDACRYCYAESFSKRYFKHLKLWGKDSTRHVTSSIWDKPRKWNKQAAEAGTTVRVFVNSLSDFFEMNDHVVEAREKAWQIIRECENIDWLILTKRPQNINRFLPPDWGEGYDNVWLGTSVGQMSDLIFARTLVLNVKAKVKWLSMEPLLENVEVYKYLHPVNNLHNDLLASSFPGITGINWVVVGGESGLKSEVRQFNLEWAKHVMQLCRDKGVAFFMKQLGANPVYPSSKSGKLEKLKLFRGSDRQGSDYSCFPKELQVREFPKMT